MQNDKDQLLATSKEWLAKIVRNIESYVEYLKDNNVTEIVSSCSHKTTMSQENAVFPSMPAGTMPPEEGLKAIAVAVAACTKCPLHQKRTKTVPGQGNSRPEILFIGEGPGEEEDRQGLAFVGQAGQLLTRLIVRMGYKREEVFIANIVKCRPPNNRKPLPAEAQACRPYLEEQIAVLKPKVIILLGASALDGLLPSEVPGRTISKTRGQWLEYEGIPAMPTFHPSYLLRNQSAMWDVWADMKKVLECLGRPVPAKTQKRTR